MRVKFRNEAACPRPLPVAGTLTGATAELEGRGEGCTVVAGAAAGVVAAAGAAAVTDGTAEVVATGGVVAAIVEVGADAAAAWIAPVPKLAGIDVPLGPDNEPEIVSAEIPFAIAVNDACRSATGATVETPGAPKSGTAVQLAAALPPVLSIVPVTQMTILLWPLGTKPESLKESSRTTEGSNFSVRS